MFGSTRLVILLFRICHKEAIRDMFKDLGTRMFMIGFFFIMVINYEPSKCVFYA